MQLYLIKTDVENSDTYIYDTKKETLTNTAPVKMKVVSLSKELFNQAMKDGLYTIVKKVYDKESLQGKELKAKDENTWQDGPLSWTTEWDKGERLKVVSCDQSLVTYQNKGWNFENTPPFKSPYERLSMDFFIINKISKAKGTKRPSENWVNKISEAKYMRCIKGKNVVSLSGWEYYDAVNNVLYEGGWGGFYATHLNKCPCPKVKSYRLNKINSKIGDWLLKGSEDVVEEVIVDNENEEPINKTEWTDKHYDFTYKLSEEEIEKGEVKLDVYKVAKVWRIGSKDDSGALWHCFKTIARFGDKNPIEREIRALYAQVKGLARESGVDLE